MQVRLKEPLLHSIDAWRRRQADLPTRPEAIRRLIEGARKANAEKDRIRTAQESCYRFMSAMAGDRPGFEEAARALFAGDATRFRSLLSAWPTDIREHLEHLSAAAFEAPAQQDAQHA